MGDLVLSCTGKLSVPEYRQTREFQASFGSPVLLPWQDLVLIVQTGWSVPPGWAAPPSRELLSTYRATVGYRNLGEPGVQLWVAWRLETVGYGVERACGWLVGTGAPEVFDVSLDQYLDVAHGQPIGSEPTEDPSDPESAVQAYPWYSTRLIRALRVYER